MQSDVRTVIELIPFPLAYMIFLSFSPLKIFLARYASSIRNEKFGYTACLTYLTFYVLCSEASSQSAPNHAQNRIKLHLNAPKSFCTAPERINSGAADLDAGNITNITALYACSQKRIRTASICSSSNSVAYLSLGSGRG